MLPIQILTRHQHVAPGAPWVGEVALLQYDHGVLGIPVEACVAYVDGCLFWKKTKSNIDKVLKAFKEDGTSYNL